MKERRKGSKEEKKERGVKTRELYESARYREDFARGKS